MSKSSSKNAIERQPRHKRGQYSPESVCWARDLLKTGFGWVDTSQKTGVPKRTLQRIAARENWYIAIQEVRKSKDILNRFNKEVSESSSSDLSDIEIVENRDVSGQIFPRVNNPENLNDPPPLMVNKGNVIGYLKELLTWSIQGIARAAGDDIKKKCWLVETLPNVLRSLIASEQLAGNSPKPLDIEELKTTVFERLAKIERPKMRPGDLGEVPIKAISDKIISNQYEEKEIVIPEKPAPSDASPVIPSFELKTNVVAIQKEVG